LITCIDSVVDFVVDILLDSDILLLAVVAVAAVLLASMPHMDLI
jgi:hypothetical protein